MLLNIDRVLQLLAEGKSVQKIAELSDVEESDVCKVIDEARKMLSSYDKAKTKKKFIIKKKGVDTSAQDESNAREDESGDDIFNGAELSAVPFESSLVMYTDGACSGNPGPTGIGIEINDNDGRTVGKVSLYTGPGTNNFAEYSAIIRALRIAIYYKTKNLKIRTDSELIVKQVKGEYRVSSDKIRPLFNEVVRLKKKVNSCRIEHVTRSLNDKADYLAKKAVSSFIEAK